VAGLALGACFLVWRDERDRRPPPHRDTATGIGAPAEAVVLPLLEAAIEWVAVARQAEAPGDAQVILVARVANPGRPSTADRWTLVVQTAEGVARQAHMRKIPAVLTVRQGGEERRFTSADALNEKAFTSPLAAGAMLRGVLWFHVPGVSAEQVNQQGSYLVLHAWDVFGNRITAAATIDSGVENVPVIFTGLSQ